MRYIVQQVGSHYHIALKFGNKKKSNLYFYCGFLGTRENILVTKNYLSSSIYNFVRKDFAIDRLQTLESCWKRELLKVKEHRTL